MAGRKYILALDQGTTSSRAMVFDHAGAVKGTGQQEFAQHYPQPGWVEHDAMEIWRSQLDTAREAMRNAGISAAQVAAIGITNQRETTVLWERATGRPVAPAIVWQDRRTAGLCDRLRAQGHAKVLQEKTGLVIDAYFAGTKLAWLLDNVAGARAAAERGELAFGTIDTWLIWQLTDGHLHCTDPGNASRTLLFNIHTQDWDDSLLQILNIPRALLPAVVPSSAVIGASAAQHFGGAIPIAGIAGDQQAATFGQACFTPGMAKNTYGTGCFMLMNVGDRPVASRQQLLSTIGWDLAGSVGDRNASAQPEPLSAIMQARPETAEARAETTDARRSQTTYLLEGGVFMAGATVQWLRDGLGLIQRSDQIQALAASVADTEDVYLVPAFQGLGAPHWDPYARGLLVGMTRGTGKGHIARAALESIALQSTELMTAMNADSGITVSELRVDGGASRNDLLMQIQADFMGVPVVRPRIAESTARGAAGLAGLACGFWSGLDELASQWQAEHRFEPAMSESSRQAKLARWRQAVELSKNWAKPPHTP